MKNTDQLVRELGEIELITYNNNNTKKKKKKKKKKRIRNSNINSNTNNNHEPQFGGDEVLQVLHQTNCGLYQGGGAAIGDAIGEIYRITIADLPIFPRRRQTSQGGDETEPNLGSHYSIGSCLITSTHYFDNLQQNL